MRKKNFVTCHMDHVSHAMHGMDMTLVMPRAEQPRVWTFHAIHTCEHVYTVIMHGGYCYFMCVYPVLIAQ